MTIDRAMLREFAIAAIGMTLVQAAVRTLGSDGVSGDGWSIRSTDILLSAGLALIFVVGRRVGRRS